MILLGKRTCKCVCAHVHVYVCDRSEHGSADQFVYSHWASGSDNWILTSVPEVYGVWNFATNYHGAYFLSFLCSTCSLSMQLCSTCFTTTLAQRLCRSACTGMFELDVRVCGNVTEISMGMQKSHSFCITCTVHVTNTICHGRYRLVNGQVIFRVHKLIEMQCHKVIPHSYMYKP